MFGLTPVSLNDVIFELKSPVTTSPYFVQDNKFSSYWRGRWVEYLVIEGQDGGAFHSWDNEQWFRRAELIDAAAMKIVRAIKIIYHEVRVICGSPREFEDDTAYFVRFEGVKKNIDLFKFAQQDPYDISVWALKIYAKDHGMVITETVGVGYGDEGCVLEMYTLAASSLSTEMRPSLEEHEKRLMEVFKAFVPSDVEEPVTVVIDTYFDDVVGTTTAEMKLAAEEIELLKKYISAFGHFPIREYVGVKRSLTDWCTDFGLEELEKALKELASARKIAREVKYGYTVDAVDRMQDTTESFKNSPEHVYMVQDETEVYRRGGKSLYWRFQKLNLSETFEKPAPKGFKAIFFDDYFGKKLNGLTFTEAKVIKEISQEFGYDVGHAYKAVRDKVQEISET